MKTKSSNHTEQKYIVSFTEQWTQTSRASTSLSELWKNPMIGDTVWEAKIQNLLLEIQGVYKKARDLIPPARIANIHSQYIEAMQYFNSTCILIHRSFREGNNTLLKEAKKELESGILKFAQITRDIIIERF
jgi:hypothetical protein